MLPGLHFANQTFALVVQGDELLIASQAPELVQMLVRPGWQRRLSASGLGKRQHPPEEFPGYGRLLLRLAIKPCLLEQLADAETLAGGHGRLFGTELGDADLGLIKLFELDWLPVLRCFDLVRHAEHEQRAVNGILRPSIGTVREMAAEVAAFLTAPISLKSPRTPGGCLGRHGIQALPARCHPSWCVR